MFQESTSVSSLKVNLFKKCNKVKYRNKTVIYNRKGSKEHLKHPYRKLKLVNLQNRENKSSDKIKKCEARLRTNVYARNEKVRNKNVEKLNTDQKQVKVWNQTETVSFN